MKSIFLVFGIAVLSYVHCDDPDIDELIANVVNDADTNKDGIIGLKEVANELIKRFDKDVDVKTVNVNRDEFVEAWSSTYGDSKETAGAFFDALDVSPKWKKGNGVLDFWDLMVHLKQIDKDGDKVITVEEFSQWMYEVGQDTQKILHSWSFYAKSMKRAFGEFHITTNHHPNA